MLVRWRSIGGIYGMGFTWQNNPPEKLLAERFQISGEFHPTNFPLIAPSQRIQEAVAHFLGEDWLPRIEKRGTAKTPMRSLSND